MAWTEHELSPLDDLTLLVTNQQPAQFHGSTNRYRRHDPYCAIHDEYGSCTCGASCAEAILANALESRSEPQVVQIVTEEIAAPLRR